MKLNILTKYLLSIVLIMCLQSPINAQIIGNEIYTIQTLEEEHLSFTNQSENNCLSINMDKNQFWQLIPIDSNYYYLVHLKSRKYLTDTGKVLVGKYHRVKAITCNTTNSQHWSVERIGNQFLITNRQTGMILFPSKNGHSNCVNQLVTAPKASTNFNREDSSKGLWKIALEE